MSMLGISFLEQIVNGHGITESGLILNELRKEIQRALHQKGIFHEAKDGMDISLCVIDSRKNTIQYSGAYSNLYLIRDGELIEYKADQMPIGIFDITLTEKDFASHIILSRPDDLIYMFSDGYADQFGGPSDKKFRKSTLKALLIEIHTLPLRQQRQKLERHFYEWKGDRDQTDDIVIIGYRI